jgi:hypothetical protein
VASASTPLLLSILTSEPAIEENFKEQISCSEKAYLMTGFKVDMLPGCDRPHRQPIGLYENEEDHFKWPRVKIHLVGHSPTRLGQDLSDDAVVRLHDQAAQFARVCGKRTTESL